MGNTVADKYEITAGEIHENQFSTFLQQMEDDLWKSDSCGLDSERKKFWQAPMGPWHVLSWIWVFSGPWGPIFLVKN